MLDFYRRRDIVTREGEYRHSFDVKFRGQRDERCTRDVSEVETKVSLGSDETLLPFELGSPGSKSWI